MCSFALKLEIKVVRTTIGLRMAKLEGKLYLERKLSLSHPYTRWVSTHFSMANKVGSGMVP